MAQKVIHWEWELKEWFIKNYKKLGYSKIIRKDIGIFPDFIMQKKGKKICVELETCSSHFLQHKHDSSLVDEVICIIKDCKLAVPCETISELKYQAPIARVSATLDPRTIQLIQELVKKFGYRNNSHVIEEAIKHFFVFRNKK